MPLDRFFLPREDIVRDKGEGGELPGSDGQVLLEKLLKTDKNHHFLAGPLFSSRTPTVLTGPVFMPTFR